MKSFDNVYYLPLVVLIVAISKHSFTQSAYNWFDKKLKICNYLDHEARLERLLDCGFGIIFYITCVTFEFYNYSGHPNIPKLIGGGGNNSSYYENYPLLTKPFNYIDGYYML